MIIVESKLPLFYLRCVSLIFSKGLYLNWAYSSPGSVATSLPINLENSLMVICERLFILRHNYEIDSFFSNGNLTVISAEFKIKPTNVISFVGIQTDFLSFTVYPKLSSEEQYLIHFVHTVVWCDPANKSRQCKLY